MKLKKIHVAIFAAFIGASSVVSADDNPMSTMFNDAMFSATPAGTYKNSLGTTYYGGSVKLRSKIVSPGQLVNIEGPSIRGGCGGLDLVAGSMHFISGEEIGNLMKGIAQNSTNLFLYSLLMSIKSQCQACSDIMTFMENIQNTVNQLNRNSCEISKDLLTGKLLNKAQRFGNALEKAAIYHSAGDGIGKKEAVETNGISSVFDTMPKSQKDSIIGGNIIYSSMEKMNVAQWFNIQDATTKDNFYALILGVLGMEIYQTNGDVPKVTEAKNTASFEDLMVKDSKTGVVGYYCTNDDCTTYEPRTIPDFKTFKDRFDEIFRGKDGKSGILEKLAGLTQSDSELTASEQSIILALSSQNTVVSELRSLATNPSVMHKRYEDMSDYYSAKLTWSFLNSILNSVLTSVENSMAVKKGDVVAKLKARRAQLAIEYSNYLKTLPRNINSFSEMNAARQAK